MPSTGNNFISWDGTNVGDLNDNGDGSWSIVMNAAKSLTANFTENVYTLDVMIEGNGSVTKVPDQATYLPGTAVQLTANAGQGYSSPAGVAI